MPQAPSCASSRSASRGKLWLRSHSAADGARRSRANARMVSRIICCDSFSNMARCLALLAGLEGQLEGNGREDAAQQPALDRRPQRTPRQPAADPRRGEHEREIADDTDRDLHQPERQALAEDVAARGIHELRQERKIEEREL